MSHKKTSKSMAAPQEMLPLASVSSTPKIHQEEEPQLHDHPLQENLKPMPPSSLGSKVRNEGDSNSERSNQEKGRKENFISKQEKEVSPSVVKEDENLMLKKEEEKDDSSSNVSLSVVSKPTTATSAQTQTSAYQERVAEFHNTVLNDRIDMNHVRRLCFGGIPECDGLRSLYWKLLLGSLSPFRSEWTKELERNRKSYADFVAELVIDPRSTQNTTGEISASSASLSSQDFSTGEERLTVSENSISTMEGLPSFVTATKVAPFLDDGTGKIDAEEKVERDSTEFVRVHAGEVSEHPLCTSEESVWSRYFKDEKLVAVIQKDVLRTFPHLHFFTSGPERNIGENTHAKALRRILFIYAKLNPGISYVQGMNEILGPIYYVFALDKSEMFAGHAEADAFFAFTSLMSEIMNSFCETLDHSSLGVKAQLKRVSELLKKHDYELWSDMEKKAIDPQFYSFRWLTLLFSQEFDLPDVLRLWDSLFADPKRFDFLYYICVAMVVRVRDQIIGKPFAANLKLLQQYPIKDIREILQCAFRLHHPMKSLSTPSAATPPSHARSHEAQRKPSQTARPQAAVSSHRKSNSSRPARSRNQESNNESAFESLENTIGSAFESLRRALS